MSPLPKVFGYVSAAVAIGSLIFNYFHPGAPLPGWLASISTLVAMFSHSATGTGGK